ncbi:hypothetical protein [Granulicella paludicola]|uniref:hypothetical protein n=1 Tax=Granulicella paludicola TaxID=474951 RepID=UPI0021E038FB|nr:hypothetical protein [Granulicella paludicola]
MPEDRGKRVSFAQQVGEEGETFFAHWATKHRLTLSKPVRDIGLDYLCQVLAPVKGSKSLEGTGSVLGAQCKAVAKSKHPRIILERIDAVDILRQNQATCLFGVQLDTGKVFFLFLDFWLMDKLKAFLDGTNATLTIPYSDLYTGTKVFLEQLAPFINPFVQNRLRLHRENQRLRRAIPGSVFSLRSSNTESIAHVQVPRLTQAYVIDPGASVSARLQIFERGYIDPNTQGVSLHPEIERLLRQTDSRALLLQGIVGAFVTVRIQAGDQEASAEFEVRLFDDETSFVHKAGLRLTFSAARKDSRGYIHQFEFNLFDPDEPFSWDSNAVEFFALFKPDAKIILPSGSEFPLKMFGQSVEQFGFAIETFKKIDEGLETDSSFALVDLKDEEVANSLNFFNAFFFENITADQMVQAFLFGPAADMRPEDLVTERVDIRLPIAVNWKSTGAVVWIDGEADAFLFDKKLCGFRLLQQNGWSVLKRERFEKSVHPEAWFYEDWPPIPIAALKVGVTNFTHEGRRLPFEAEISRRPNPDLEQD